ncbi:hypothetical protein GC169_06275 [bacterium]|nr:hypothetical protein [bacterium]
MIYDVMLVGSFVGFIAAWVWRRHSIREQALWLLAFAVLITAFIGFLEGRWQAVPAGGVGAVLLAILAIKRSRGPAPKAGLAWASGAGIALLSLASLIPIYLFPLFNLPEPTGQHPVGVRDFDLVDESRTMEAATGQPEGGGERQARKLFVRVWYPAAFIEDAEVRPYATRDEVAAVFEPLATAFRLPPFFFSHLTQVGTHSHVDAPALSATGGRLPVVFFSHGYGSYGSQNWVLMEELASHGYVVFAVTHTGDSAGVLFADGSTARAKPPEQPGDGGVALPPGLRKLIFGVSGDERFAGVVETAAADDPPSLQIKRSAPIWTADRQFIKATLSNGQGPASIADIVAAADFSRVAHMGMSFGGSTSGAVCLADPACVAAVNLDGGDYHYTTLGRTLPAPFLMMHADWRTMGAQIGVDDPVDPNRAFNDFSYEAFAAAGTNPGVYRMRINGVAHLGLSDMGLMLRQPVRGLLAGPRDGAEVVWVINRFTLGFLDKHMRGMGNSFPDETFAAFPEATTPHDASWVRDWFLAKSPDEQARITAEADRIAGRSPAAETP